MGGETQTCIMVEGRRLICNLDGFSVIPSLPFVLFTQDSNNFHGAVVARLGTGCGRPLHVDFLSLFFFWFNYTFYCVDWIMLCWQIASFENPLQLFWYSIVLHVFCSVFCSWLVISGVFLLRISMIHSWYLFYASGSSWFKGVDYALPMCLHECFFFYCIEWFDDQLRYWFVWVVFW